MTHPQASVWKTGRRHSLLTEQAVAIDPAMPVLDPSRCGRLLWMQRIARKVAVAIKGSNMNRRARLIWVVFRRNRANGEMNHVDG